MNDVSLLLLVNSFVPVMCKHISCGFVIKCNVSFFERNKRISTNDWILLLCCLICLKNFDTVLFEEKFFSQGNNKNS